MHARFALYHICLARETLIDERAATIASLDIRVGKIIGPGSISNPLYTTCVRVDVGDAEARVICIADSKMQHLATGSTVLVVCNLSPKTVRDIRSHGGILCVTNAAGQSCAIPAATSCLPGDRITYVTPSLLFADLLTPFGLCYRCCSDASFGETDAVLTHRRVRRVAAVREQRH